MNDKKKDWEQIAGSLGARNRELKAELATALRALAELRELTKASTPRATGGGAPDFVLFKLPKDGALRAKGIGILDRADRILEKSGKGGEA